MFEFSDISKKRLEEVHKDLQLVIYESLKYSPIDFGISQGYRSPETQFELFKKGRKFENGEWIIDNPREIVTYLDGYNKKSKHNYNPSKAIDIYAYIPNKPHLAWNENHLSAIYGVIISTANRLFEENKISHKVVGGYNWDGDGEIITDQNFQDGPHFQLVD